MEVSKLRSILSKCCVVIEREARSSLQALSKEVPNDIRFIQRKWDRAIHIALPVKANALTEFGYASTREGSQKFTIDMVECVKNYPHEARQLPDPFAVAVGLAFNRENIEPLPDDIMRRVMVRYLIQLEEYDDVAEEIRESLSSASVEERFEELRGRLVQPAIDSLAPEGLGHVDGWLRFSITLHSYAMTGDLELLQELREKLDEIYQIVE